VIYAKKPLGARLARNAVVAASAITLLLATSCLNDNVGRLLKERASFKMKKDSVEQAYNTKIEALKPSMDEKILGVEPRTDDFYREREEQIDMLYKQREEQKRPFENKIDSINLELRKYDVFGKRLGNTP
jgi:hypothetical protein